MSYNNTSVSSYIRPLSVCISYHVATNGYYYADGYEPTQVFTRDADALVVVREFEQAHICNPTASISYVGGFYPAWPINNPFAGLEGDVDYSVSRNGKALWSFYTWEQDGEDQVATHCVHVQVVDGVNTVTIGDVALGYTCAVEVAVDTTVVTLAEALEALEVAELEADEAALYADTEEGYQAYCAAVQRLFEAEDTLLAVGELEEELYVPTDRVDEEDKVRALKAAVLAAREEADVAATRASTWKGYQEYCAAVQRLCNAEDALEYHLLG